MPDNKIKFLRGTADEYAAAEKDNDTFYYTTDNGKLYIGNKEVSGGDSITIDTELSDTSTNSVQNKVIKQALDKKADKTVATTTADGLMSAADKTKLNNVGNTYALKSKYGDTTIDVGRKFKTDVGQFSTAEGRDTTASGYSSHAEGRDTTASGYSSHAEGIDTTASGNFSHAEGYGTTARGNESHSEGNCAVASGSNSHAEGTATTASADSSHAEGKNTTASGGFSHAGGFFTNALHQCEVAYGQYNESNDDTLFSIGDGTADDKRHNAFEITKTGGKLHDKNIATVDDIPSSLPASDVSAWAKAPTKPSYTASEVGADPSGSANTALNNAKSYTNTKIADLINGAPSTLDTLGEIAEAMENNQSVVEALNSAIGTKADESDLTSHTGNKSNPHGVTKAQVGLGNVPNVATNDQTPSYTEATTLAKISSGEKLSVAFGKISKAINDLIAHIGDNVKHITSTERTNWNSAKIHADSAHAPSNAQANQNAFSNIVVGSTTVAADTATDTLTLVGSNVTLTPDATNDKVTIGITKANVTSALGYTPPTTNTTYTSKNAVSGGTDVSLVTTGEKYNWNSAKTHADSAHAPSNAQANVIEIVKVNGKALTPSSKAVDITVPSVGNGTITIKQAGTTKGTFTTNQSGNTTIELTDSNTTYGVATSSALGLVKSGTDITVDSSGNVSVNDDSHNHVISNVDGLQSALDGKAASSHTHDDRYYTESEINTKLNAKASTAVATTSANGLMSSSDKTKLNGIATGANNYVLPQATTKILGGVMPDGMTINVDENGVISTVGGLTVDTLLDITITKGDSSSGDYSSCSPEPNSIITFAGNVTDYKFVYILPLITSYLGVNKGELFNEYNLPIIFSSSVLSSESLQGLTFIDLSAHYTRMGAASLKYISPNSLMISYAENTYSAKYRFIVLGIK